jgi:hypothetical protein
MKPFNSLQSISWARKALFTELGLLSRRKHDFILSRATPQYGHLHALILSWWLGIPWIANWSDPMPPQKAPFPYSQGPNASVRSYLYKYCSAVAHNATWHTFPCERLRKYFCSCLPEYTVKSSIIPYVALARFQSAILAAYANYTNLD